ncbi:MAG: class I SAM-dependent methyltransferase [Alphaproteobacteria bacterium]|nr:class I SAM-dependent methyltransferase [Alphaproteobacteria bacterium]
MIMEESKTEFDEHSQNYKDLVNNSVNFSGLTVDFFTQGKADFFNHLLKDKKEHVVLDIGCGVGDLHSYLAQKGRKISGVDVSAESIKIAKNTNKGNIYSVYDGEKLPFDDNTFDAVLTTCVMHHVPPAQWQRFIDEMVRVTKKEGTLAIFEHNPFNPLTRIAVNRCPFDKDAVLLRAKQIEGMLSKTKQIKAKSSYMFFTPFKHNLFKKLDNLLSWLPLGAQYCTYGQKN